MGNTDTGKFLKKRAPFYMAAGALLVVFVVPALTEKGLEDIIPDTLEAQERIVLDYVLKYDGGDGSGINMLQAVTDKIKEDYPDGNVFGHRSTTLDATVSTISTDTYRIILDFKSYDNPLYFDWEVDMDMGTVRGGNNISKDVVDVVDFYD